MRVCDLTLAWTYLVWAACSCRGGRRRWGRTKSLWCLRGDGGIYGDMRALPRTSPVWHTAAKLPPGPRRPPLRYLELTLREQQESRGRSRREQRETRGKTSKMQKRGADKRKEHTIYRFNSRRGLRLGLVDPSVLKRNVCLYVNLWMLNQTVFDLFRFNHQHVNNQRLQSLVQTRLEWKESKFTLMFTLSAYRSAKLMRSLSSPNPVDKSRYALFTLYFHTFSRQQENKGKIQRGH